MDKIKKRLSDLPVKHTFVLLMVLFVMIAFVLAELEKTLLNNAQYNIAFRYLDTVEGFNSERIWGDGTIAFISEYDSSLMKLYELLIWLTPSITYLMCSGAASTIFFRVKIKQPMKLISDAAQRISNNDLNFILAYEKHDEMGSLCASFEKMRFALQENNREMWRQMNERKRLNAAFSHDLRTPLTVLEGYLGILQNYVLEGKLSLDEIMETYSVMGEQISRLKNYVSCMSALQRLGDVPIEKQTIGSDNFIGTLKDTAAIVCSEKTLAFNNVCDDLVLFIDAEIVMQVFENLMSNAVRYANTTVSVTCRASKDTFSICVVDDGKGFDAKGMKAATEPFYSTDKKDGGQHFGLGLNICKVLCQRHGGLITVKNDFNGGAEVTVSFDMSQK